MPTIAPYAPGPYKAGQQCTYLGQVWEKIKAGTVTSPPKVGTVWKLVGPMEIVPAGVDITYSVGTDNVAVAEVVSTDPTIEDASYRQITALPWTGAPVTDAACDGVYLRKLPNGKYYQRQLQDGVLNLRWYLKGVQDVQPVLQNLIDTLARTRADLQPLVMVWPAGIYYASQSIQFHSLDLTVFAFGVTLRTPLDAGVQFLRSTDAPIKVFGLRTQAVSADAAAQQDGMIPRNSVDYRQWLAKMQIQPTDVSRRGVGLGLGDDEQLTRSIRPTDFNCHGFYSTMPVELYYCEPIGYSVGAFLNGGSIGSNENVSLSKIIGGNYNQNGTAVCIVGNDANQCTIDGVSGRDSTNFNFYSDCQEGNIFSNCHATSSGWGNYQMLGISAGDTVANCYSEGDSTKNRFYGYTVVYGGRMDRNEFIPGDFAQISLGARTNVQSVDYLQAVQQFTFPNGQGQAFALRYVNNGTSLQWENGNDKGVHELTSFMGRTSSGRGGCLSGSATAAFYPGGVQHLTAPSLQYALDEVTAFWRAGEVLNIKPWDGHGPRQYECIAGGLSGQDATYASIEGATVTSYDGGTQNLLLSKPSNILTDGDSFVINGTAVYLETHQPTSDGSYQIISLGYPGVNLNGSSGTITYTKPYFRAVGRGTGTMAQRPQLQAGGDIGFPYWNTDLNNGLGWEERWTGETFQPYPPLP